MAIQVINIGSTADDGTGESIRSAFDKSNQNFAELDTEVGTLTTDVSTLNADVADLDFLTVVDKSANYTILESDNRRVIRCTASLTLSFPSALSAGHSVLVIAVGDIQVTFASSGGSTLIPEGVILVNPDSSTISTAVVIHRGSNEFYVNAALPGTVVVNAQTGTSYTYDLGDTGVLVTHDNAAAIAVTIPTNASVAFPIGTVIAGSQLGAGLVTITGATGVTVNGVSAGSVDSSGQYSSWTATKLATDTWLLTGGVV